MKLYNIPFSFFFFFFKERLDLEVHERIAYECFAYLWGVAVLQSEDAGESKIRGEGC